MAQENVILAGNFNATVPTEASVASVPTIAYDTFRMASENWRGAPGEGFCMRIAVTGASGHVGANLVRLLLDRGHDVTVLVREDTRAMAGLEVRRVVGDVLDAASLKTAFESADVVFHLAAVISLAYRHDARAEQVNVEGTRAAVEVCVACGVGRLIHCSSVRTFTSNDAIDETSPRCPAQGGRPYGRSKAAAEDLIDDAVAAGLDAVVVNPTGIIGPHDYKPSAMGGTLLQLARGRMPAVVQGGFDWVDARDVALGMLGAAEQGRTGERYLLSGHYASFRELAEWVEAATGSPVPWISISLGLAGRIAPFAEALARFQGKPPRFTRASISALRSYRPVSHEKATRELAFTPRPLQTTIHETLDWFRQHGGLE
jgi:dihydroflavonol-4-reductase